METQQLDRFGAPLTGLVPGFEDLADPTFASVATAGDLLIGFLEARQHDSRITTCCTDVATFRQALHKAITTTRNLVAALERHRPIQIESRDGQALMTRCEELVQAIVRAQRATVNGLNFALAPAWFESLALWRMARAAWRGRCMAGQARTTSCSPDSNRVRLRVTDDVGHDDQDPGCVWHVAEQYCCWDPAQVDLTLIGPAPAADMVRRLGDAFELSETYGLVKDMPYELLVRAAEKAAYPYAVLNVFSCPKCNTSSHNPHDFDEGYCGRCKAFTGRDGHEARFSE